jgi:hypothetical protein
LGEVDAPIVYPGTETKFHDSQLSPWSNMSNTNSESRNYWFPAKRYGWGWGVPSVWQGWATLIIYLCLIVAGAIIFPPGEELTTFIALTVLLTLILIVICWVKGEPPRWRWGDDKND